jgi:hypothetical protein
VPADAVPNDQCKWAGFISHHQAGASHQVLWLGGKIEKKLTERRHRLTGVWIDKQECADPDGMNEGVRLSRNFILFLTKEVLSSEWCLKEIRDALKHRKNVILVFQTDKRYGGVPGPFSEFYGPELKKAFPNADDFTWLTRKSYVAFHDRGQHVDVMLCDPKCKNGILDQMEFEEAESATTSLSSSSQSCPQSQGESSRTSLARSAQQVRIACVFACVRYEPFVASPYRCAFLHASAGRIRQSCSGRIPNVGCRAAGRTRPTDCGAFAAATSAFERDCGGQQRACWQAELASGHATRPA